MPPESLVAVSSDAMTESGSIYLPRDDVIFVDEDVPRLVDPRSESERAPPSRSRLTTVARAVAASRRMRSRSRGRSPSRSASQKRTFDAPSAYSTPVPSAASTVVSSMDGGDSVSAVSVLESRSSSSSSGDLDRESSKKRMAAISDLLETASVMSETPSNAKNIVNTNTNDTTINTTNNDNDNDGRPQSRGRGRPRSPNGGRSRSRGRRDRSQTSLRSSYAGEDVRGARLRSSRSATQLSDYPHLPPQQRPQPQQLSRSVRSRPASAVGSHVSVVSAYDDFSENGDAANSANNNSSPSFAHASPDHSFRVIVVLLNPRTRKFELIHVYYDNESAMVRDILERTPENATYGPLRRQKYVGLCRPNTNRELINSFMTKDYDIVNDEILIAVPQGYTAQQCSSYARPILTNDRLVRMIQDEDPRWKEENTRASNHSAQSSSDDDDSTIVTANWDDDVLKEVLVALLDRLVLPLVRLLLAPFRRRRGRPATGKRRRRRRLARAALRSLLVVAAVGAAATAAHRAASSPARVGETLRGGRRWRERGLRFGGRTARLAPDGAALDVFDADGGLLWRLSTRGGVAVDALVVDPNGDLVGRDADGRRVRLDRVARGPTATDDDASWLFETVPPAIRRRRRRYTVHWWGLE